MKTVTVVITSSVNARFVRSVEVAVVTDESGCERNIESVLEGAFCLGQNEANPLPMPSASVGDLFMLTWNGAHRVFICRGNGFLDLASVGFSRMAAVIAQWFGDVEAGKGRDIRLDAAGWVKATVRGIVCREAAAAVAEFDALKAVQA